MNNSLNYNTALNVIKGGNNCLLGVVDEDNTPYIVPINYNLNNRKDEMTISFLSKKASKKVNCIKNNSNVTLYFKSTSFADMLTVIGNGIATVNEKEEDDMVLIDVKLNEISGRYFN